MKARRQAAILEVVDREGVKNQDQLRRRLRGRGLAATQATISRDIKELGLVKRASDGSYHRARDEAPPAAVAGGVLKRALAEYLARIDRVQQLVLLRTGPGQAQLLALALDRANLPEVVGTVAGDDTILVISRDTRRARALERRLGELTGG